jgi:hypothetical protein
VLIVAGWLATVGWFVAREVWPNLRRDEAPPYRVNLAEETTLSQLRSHTTQWSVYRDRVEIGKEIGKARTWLTYRPADDSFDLHSELYGRRTTRPGLAAAVTGLSRLVGELFMLAAGAEASSPDRHGDPGAVWLARAAQGRVSDYLALVPQPHRPGDLDPEPPLMAIQVPQLFGPAPLEFAVMVPRLVNTHRVNRAGALVADAAEGSLRFRLRSPGDGLDVTVPVGFRIEAEARPEGWARRGELTVEGRTVKVRLRPVPLRTDSIYRPGSLLGRIDGLHVGQRWRLPPDDPLDEAVQEALPQVLEQFGIRGAGEVTRFLKDRLPPEKETEAEVRPAPGPLPWNNRDYECLQIVYTREGRPFATTWVRRDDGLVLRQEWDNAGLRLIFQRD